MVTALIIAMTATALILVAVILVVAGWFPRLAALTVRGLETVIPDGHSRLDARDRAEMTARLWVL